VWLCMFYVYMPQNCYLGFLAFLGQGLAFFGEDRLATLLCSSARFDLANWGVRQPVQPHTNAQLLVFDDTLVQPNFAVVNCSDAVMSVFYSPFSTRSQNVELWTPMLQHWAYFPPISWLETLIVYIQCNDTKKGECV